MHLSVTTGQSSAPAHEIAALDSGWPRYELSQRRYNYLDEGQVRCQYDAFARGYHRYFGRFYKPYAHELTQFLDRNGFRTLGRILLIGGKSEFLIHSLLRCVNPKITVSETSAKMLAECRSIVDRRYSPDSIEWVKASYADLPFSSGSFDLVLSIYIADMCCFSSDGLLDEMKRVARPGGLVVVGAMDAEIQALWPRFWNSFYLDFVFEKCRPVWGHFCRSYTPHSIPVTLTPSIQRVGLEEIDKICFRKWVCWPTTLHVLRVPTNLHSQSSSTPIRA